MKKVIGVRFKRPGKIYFFDPGKLEITKQDYVIVETASGEEYGEVVIANRMVKEEIVVTPLKKVIRIATPKDKKHYEENKRKEKEAFSICLEKIKKHKLEMNLTDVEYKFDNSKLLFYFTADGRIDFRELVKDLAAIFKTRIENFETVSIKMAKEQNISLNPSKISGNCGRLMCCLKYEQDVYEEKLKKLPKVGAIVKTADGEGIVDRLETLKEKVNVKFKDGDGFFYKKYDAKDVKVVKNAMSEKVDPEELEHQKELEQLEELDKLDTVVEDEEI